MRETAYQKWSITQQALSGLLAALGSDGESAGNRYVELRRNLVRLFEWRGCPTPDEYADETLNRCARKIAEGEQIRDVPTYCIGIARMLLLEMSRNRAKQPRSLADAPEPYTAPAQTEGSGEIRLECLKHCLSRLPNADRDLILGYYQGDKSEKINRRKELIKIMEVPASTLRMRALRIREKLHSCLETCLRKKPKGAAITDFSISDSGTWRVKFEMR